MLRRTRVQLLAASASVSCFNPAGGDESGATTAAASSSSSAPATGTSGADDPTTSAPTTTSPTTTTASDATSTAIGPTCGDGEVTDDELCDDGNTLSLDGCSNTCTRDARYVFASSERYTAAFGGVVGADQRCTSLADAAGLPGTYVAWISVPGNPAIGRLGTTLLPYVRTDGFLVAANGGALITAMSVGNPIASDEYGDLIPLGGNPCQDPARTAWTATDTAGLPTPDNNCQLWTSDDPGADGDLGDLAATDSSWASGCTLPCDSAAHLYCFEKDLGDG